ncbi:MAG: chemotaxis protein CheA [Geobacteraceae bacterium]|nr:chemotaxis protein CheA [Geobacteraceae bacterium]
MTDYHDPLSKAAKDFLAEAEEIFDQLSGDILLLGDSVGKEECAPETVNSIFRSAHSLKGLAGMFGYGEIAELSHNLESLLDYLRLGKIELSEHTLAVLFDAVEVLGSLVRSASSEAGGQADLAPVLDRITTCISGARVEAATLSPADLGISEKTLHALTEYEEHRLKENIARGKSLCLIHASYSLDTFDRELGELLDLLKDSGEVISTLPSAEGGLENSIGFDILFGATKKPEELFALLDLKGASYIRLGGSAVGSDVQCEGNTSLPKQEDSADTAVSEGEASPLTARSISHSMRVDISKLDDLMNIVGELILFHGTVSSISEKMRIQGFSGLAVELGKTAKGMERKLNELQKRVMEVRMVPVGQLFEKMSRIVRKISREQDKLIDLKLSGSDTELDKMIVEDIADPLMHIIRNSIDHGIETPAERRKYGKDERGTIKLSSYQKGNHVVIEIEDDGRGIDPGKIVKKALALGLIESDEGLSQKDILDILFLPGFSTAAAVSDISGRGVGMDVVKNNIASVSGTVEITSTPGEGSRVIITLPITLAIIKALLVETSGRSYGIPITSVRETLSLEDVEISTVERKEVMQPRDATLPLLRLENYFNCLKCDELSANSYVVVVGENERRVGIMVNDLLGQQDIVIKSLGDTFKGVRGVAGAADLGDQRTILILDVSGIVSETTKGGA